MDAIACKFPGLKSMGAVFSDVFKLEVDSGSMLQAALHIVRRTPRLVPVLSLAVTFVTCICIAFIPRHIFAVARRVVMGVAAFL
eukprot:1108884-Rhodomonas_salina.2